VVELLAGGLIFLKVNHIADTLESDKHIHSRTLHPIYGTASVERGYIHKKLGR